MRPVPVVPQQVPAASVRPVQRGAVEGPPRVDHLQVAGVAAPIVVPRQLDPVTRRLTALQRENADLRTELDRLRSA